MEKTQFWSIVAKAREQGAGDCDTLCESLKQLLIKLTPEEIIGFDLCVREYRHLAYRADLWGAAYLMIGGCSNDGFEYFRCWLISQGETVYMNALQDPETLAEIDEREIESGDEFECEQFMYTPDEAYREITGKDMPEVVRSANDYPELVGMLWTDDDDLDAKYPKIVARFEGS